jgi:hypothetical protein
MISALRIVIDSEQANVVDGGRADLGRLVVATDQLIKLLPVHKLDAPVQREDPRQVMWEIYQQMRERGEIDLKADEGLLQAKIDEQAAEIDRLRAQLAGELPAPKNLAPAQGCESVPLEGSTATDPPTSDIVPPCERAECDVDPWAAPAPRPAGYDYHVERGWRDHVLPDGTITPTPMSRGRWWGPV